MGVPVVNQVSPFTEYCNIASKFATDQKKNLQKSLGWNDDQMNQATKALGGLLVLGTVYSNMGYAAISGITTYLLKDKAIELKNSIDAKWKEAPAEAKAIAIAAAVFITLFHGVIATICLTAYSVAYLCNQLNEKQGIVKPPVFIEQVIPRHAAQDAANAA